jgi:hypothetical protein
MRVSTAGAVPCRPPSAPRTRLTERLKSDTHEEGAQKLRVGLKPQSLGTGRVRGAELASRPHQAGAVQRRQRACRAAVRCPRCQHPDNVRERGEARTIRVGGAGRVHAERAVHALTTARLRPRVRPSARQTAPDIRAPDRCR